MTGNDNWIQKAVKRPGDLSHKLKIPLEENIPITILKAIKKADVGTTIYNPTQRGVTSIKVTPLLKKQANFALNVRKL